MIFLLKIFCINLIITNHSISATLITQNFKSAVSEILIEALASQLSFNNSTVNSNQFLENLANHGCWCSKILYNYDQINNNNDVSSGSNRLSFFQLGGSEPIDAIDEICMDWHRARRCNDEFSGGSCFEYDEINNGLHYSFSNSTCYDDVSDKKCLYAQRSEMI